MAVELLGACPDMGFSKAWLAHMSYAHKDAAHGGGGSKDAQAAHRRRLGSFMEQLIGRPVT